MNFPNMLENLQKQAKKPMVMRAIFATVVLGAGLGTYFILPASKKDALKGMAAIAVKSWRDTFGGSPEEYIVDDINLADLQPSPAPPESESSPPPKKETANVTAKTEKKASEVVVGVDTKKKPVATNPTTSIVKAPAKVLAIAPQAVAAEPPESPQPSPPLPPQCIISATSTLSRKIILNEIGWMGSPPLSGETSLTASNREWMELKNISGAPLNVSGWQVLDAAEKIKIVLDDGISLPTDGFLLLERGDDAVPEIVADKTYVGGLSNSGDILEVVDAVCGASDVLDASDGWPGGDNAAKKTLERDADGVGWHTSVVVGGTPRAENSKPANVLTVVTTSTATTATTTTVVCATSTATSTTQASSTTTIVATSTPPLPTAPNHLVITEIQIVGASSTNDFVRIFNPTASTVDISQWKLHKKSSTGTDSSIKLFPNGSTIAPGGSFLWGNSADGFGDTIGANVTSTATLAADNSVALLDAQSIVVDAVAWGTGANQYVEVAAYPTNPAADQVLKRKFLGGAAVDTDNNADDFTF